MSARLPDFNGSDPDPPTLAKALGKWSAMAMVVGAVIGSGIFAKPGANALVGQSVGLIMLAWFVGGVITVIGGVCLAELALMMPKAGGTYVYIRKAYGRIPAFLAGWNESVFFQSSANSALAIFFVMNLSTLIGKEFSNPEMIMIALGLITLLTMVNCVGVFWGGLVQNITTIIKVGFLVLIACLPFLVLFIDTPSFDSSNYTTSFTSVETPSTMLMMFTLVMLNVMWAYSGGWMVTGIAEEIKDPQKNLSWALVGGAVVLFVIYVLVNISFHGILSLEQMVDIEHDDLRQVPQEALGAYLEPIGPNLAKFGKGLLSSIILVSVFSALNTGLLTPPRVLFAMARDEMFIPSFARIHPRFKTPHVAIIGQGCVTAVVMLVVSAYVMFQSQESGGDAPLPRGSAATSIFEYLTGIAVFSSTIFIVLTVASIFVLRRKYPDMERPYKIPGYPIVPAISLLANAVFLILVGMNDLIIILFSGAFLLCSLPLYFLFSRTYRQSDT
ncbi:MAG: amino acid permease [Planctomycetota bacterium]|nr:amino acid permease [Planctomycetota bacterium]